VGKKSYTILVVPDRNEDVRRFRVPATYLKAALAGACLLVIIFGMLTVRYFILKHRTHELSCLISENRDLKIQVRGLSQKIEVIQKKLAQVSHLDHKVRVLTGLEKNFSGDSMMAVGGPESAESLLYLRPNLSSMNIKELRKVHSDLNDLEGQLTIQELSLQELQEFLEDRRSLLACTPSIWPLKGWVSSGFGWRRSPYSHQRQMHEGIDIAAPIGSLIRAPADGIVTFAGLETGYGRLISIHHGYGISTRYGHCSEILVEKGERVKRSQPIATVGVSGRATGPHLHYEVRVNKVPVNPRKYLLD
jgi:hypothetical protein